MTYFKKVFLTPLFLALVALLSVQTAHAEVEKVCAPSNKTELKQALLRWSPFEGFWTWRQDRSETGPMKMTVREMAGVPYLIWSSRNSKKEQIGPAEYSVRFVSENAFEFAFSSAHFELKLTKDCAIRGTEFHKKFGAVDINLPAEGSGTPAGGGTPDTGIETKEALREYLVESGRRTGSWRWGERSAPTSFHFKEQDGEITGTFMHTPSGKEPKVVKKKAEKVELLSASLVRIKLPGKWAHMQLELQSDGSLEGVQVLDGKYALLITLN